MLEQEIIIGRFCLRPHRELLLDGKVIALGSKPLSVLAEATGQLVTKDELMMAV